MAMHFVGDSLLAHAKGGCYRCLRGDNLVDLDIQIEGEGALVLCKGCLLEAAEAGDLALNAAAVSELVAQHAEDRRQFAPERVAELEGDVATARAALTQCQTSNASLQDALRLVRSGGRQRS